MTPGKLIESTWAVLEIYPKGPALPGGMPRGLGALSEELVSGLRRLNELIPYIAYQYDGGTIAQAHSGIRETERSVAYVLWHYDLYQAETAEKKFFDALLKTKRIVGINPLFSFTDTSTAARTGPGEGIGGFHAVQRDVLIRI